MQFGFVTSLLDVAMSHEQFVHDLLACVEPIYRPCKIEWAVVAANVQE